ncbi:uncharacterized protein LOC108087281 [Drosophila ficusphila]|uniref:uncharacterized protein LOC108087281 n=1 Tax=Drosophila ficusphila TaxID=30025 RepID=UPI001C8AB9DB|nr:uncharacterized protein LOC108087281 [Drosophila ficusphila]
MVKACFSKVKGSYKFNALNCEIYAPELGEMKQCHIKAIDRKHNKIDMEAVLFKTITKFDIHFKMVKREIGGWHPFMYDMKVDLCKFFRNRRKFFIANLIYSFMKEFTNVNHTCPFLAGESLQLVNWTPDEAGVLAKFPVDPGQYGLQTTWYINKIMALKINGSIIYF